MYWAHWACDQLGQGAKKEHIVVWMSQYYPALSPDVGLNAEFLRVAALYYCPEHKTGPAGRPAGQLSPTAQVLDVEPKISSYGYRVLTRIRGVFVVPRKVDHGQWNIR